MSSPHTPNRPGGAGNQEPHRNHAHHPHGEHDHDFTQAHDHEQAHRDPEPAHRHHGHGHDGHGQHDAHDKHAGHSPAMFRDRFWFSLALTLPILYFSESIQEWLNYRAVAFPGSEWVSPVLATILFLYGGLVFLQGAGREVAVRRPGMMTLISLAITVAYVYSMAVVFGLPGMPFFWELATLIAIMLLGHWLEMASVQGASRALDELTKLLPTTAHLLDGRGGVREVAVAELEAGVRILIRPGEQVPADGRVTEGRSSVNESFLTGESRPVVKSMGDEVVAGAVNGEGALTVEVSRTGGETTLSQIQRLVQEAQSSRSRFQNLADRAAGWLFYMALAAGVVTLLAWLVFSGDLHEAITRTVTVLVIACPHALGLAIPLVIVNATALSARNGIVVRNREAFERARHIKVVAFDKTGTLTEGRFALRGVAALGDEDELTGIAAAIERRSEHPLAQALTEVAQRRGLEPLEVADFEVVAGKGVLGTVAGDRYAVGRPEWVHERGLVMPEPLLRSLAEAEDRGESAIVLMSAQAVLAVFAFADRVRAGAAEAVRALKAAGVEPVMITGDAEAVARTVAEELAIEHYHARVLPADKARLVRNLKARGAVAFVGDGINDSPALVEADLGVAIGAGTNVAIESADLVLVDDDPADVVLALGLARASYGKMIQNLFWATGYNVVAIPLAAGALVGAGFVLSPALGAVLMSLSTVVVAVNAMTLRLVRK